MFFSSTGESWMCWIGESWSSIQKLFVGVAKSDACSLVRTLGAAHELDVWLDSVESNVRVEMLLRIECLQDAGEQLVNIYSLSIWFIRGRRELLPLILVSWSQMKVETKCGWNPKILSYNIYIYIRNLGWVNRTSQDCNQWPNSTQILN